MLIANYKGLKLLPFSLTVQDGAADPTTLCWLLIWFVVAFTLVIAALILLYWLAQRDELGEDASTSRPEPISDGTDPMERTEVQ